jgi:catechol 2,3-dioxygenase-like lactoylglutathione lyase family enzyme
MLYNLDHVAFAVSDLDRSLHFYRDLLGLEFILRRVWDEEYVRQMVGIPDAVLDIALLKLPGDKGSPLDENGKFVPAKGDAMLELIEYRQPKGRAVDSQVYTPGNAHLGMLVDDMDALYERLVAEGVQFISPPMTSVAGPNKGRKTVYLRDPDGIVVQLMQP